MLTLFQLREKPVMTESVLPLYVVAQEYGREPGLLPTWADHGDDVLRFDNLSSEQVSRVDIDSVPGAFHLDNVLSSRECEQFLKLSEMAGFHEDSPVSLPHEIRHNHNFNWVVSEYIDQTIWNRCQNHVTEIVDGRKAVGLNARFRFYRYQVGDFFKPHTDGAWPGSRVIDGKLVQDAYDGIYSEYTFLIFLSDGYSGGRTQFFVSKSNPESPAVSQDDLTVINVETAKGSVLCFPHGNHPQHCLHAGESISDGTKYIIRTDILYA